MILLYPLALCCHHQQHQVSAPVQERERQEDFRTARSEWLSSLFENSFFGTMSNRYRVTGSLDKKIRLQEELISNIRKALPDQKKFSNVKKVLGEVDLSWLTDKDQADHQKIEAPKTVYVLSFDGDPTAAGVSLLQQAGCWLLWLLGRGHNSD